MELENYVLLANVLLILLLILSIAKGYKNGLVLSIINLCGWIFALIVAWMFYPTMSELLMIFPMSLLGEDNILSSIVQVYCNQLLWFIIIFFITKLLTTILRPIAKIFNKLPIVKEVNGLLGALFGTMIALFYSIIACFILSMPFVTNGAQIIDQSLLRYTNVISYKVSDIIMTGADELLEIYDLVGDTHELSDEDIARVGQWLNDNNIDQEAIDAFIESLN